jgi:hypothetical protein
VTVISGLKKAYYRWPGAYSVQLFKRNVPRRGPSGPGCRAILWGLACFALLQLGLAVAIEVRMPELRDPYYGFKLERLQQKLPVQKEGGQLVVMLGSSRTAFGLMAGDLESQLSTDLGKPIRAFNFGIPGAGPVIHLLNLKRLLADGVRPDFLLVEVLPPLLCEHVEASPEVKWLPANRLWHRELSLLDSIGFSVAELRSDWWLGWPVPSHSHRFAIVSAFAPNWLPWDLRQDWGRGTDDHGWSAPLYQVKSPEERRQAVERAHQGYCDYLSKFRLGRTPCQAQREILEECRRQNIPVALVLMPEGPTFQSWYSSKARRQFESFLNRMCEQHAVPMIDARCWIGEEGFSDSHHMLVNGAKCFTRRLGREALVPLLRQQTFVAQELGSAKDCP